jgi:YD repeat-containing protein
VSSTTTVTAKAFKSGMYASPAASAAYAMDVSGAVPTPSIVPAGGRFVARQTATVTGAAGTTLRYTVNGADPTHDGYSLTFDYDTCDRKTKMTFPDGTYLATTYSRLDPVTERDRMGRLTRTVYDALRRPVAVRDLIARSRVGERAVAGKLHAASIHDEPSLLQRVWSPPVASASHHRARGHRRAGVRPGTCERNDRQSIASAGRTDRAIRVSGGSTRRS